MLDAFSGSGVLISTLYLMFLAVSIIDFCLNFTGLSDFIALDVLGWLRSLDLGGSGSGFLQLMALLTTMALAVLLGMGMPAVPAYINVALLMGPVLAYFILQWPQPSPRQWQLRRLRQQRLPKLSLWQPPFLRYALAL